MLTFGRDVDLLLFRHEPGATFVNHGSWGAVPRPVYDERLRYVVSFADSTVLSAKADRGDRGARDRGQSDYRARPPLGFYFVTIIFLVIPEI